MERIYFRNNITLEQLKVVLQAVHKNGGALPDDSTAYDFQRDADGSIRMLWRNSLLEEHKHLATFHFDDTQHDFTSISISTDLFFQGTSRYSDYGLTKDLVSPYGFFTDHNLYRFQDEDGRSILQDALSGTAALYENGLSSQISLNKYPDITAKNAIYVAQGIIAYTHPNSEREFLVSSGASPCVIFAMRNKITGVTAMAHFDSATDIPSELDKIYQSVSGDGEVVEVHLAGDVAGVSKKNPSVSISRDIKESLGGYANTIIVTDLTGRERIAERLGINVRTGEIMTEFPYRYPPDYGPQDSKQGQFIIDQREFNLSLGFKSSAEQPVIQQEDMPTDLSPLDIKEGLAFFPLQH